MTHYGRNHPCPCGSGRKHKLYCLLTSRFEPVPIPQPPPWQAAPHEKSSRDKIAGWETLSELVEDLTEEQISHLLVEAERAFAEKAGKDQLRVLINGLQGKDCVDLLKIALSLSDLSETQELKRPCLPIQAVELYPPRPAHPELVKGRAEGQVVISNTRL